MTDRLTVLGCSGGIGRGLRTTSFLWNEDVLIDAGTGVGDLELEALRRIDHILLTHSHLDHIVSIPFLADSIGASRDTPIEVHGLPETLEAIRRHLFAEPIWPDFTVIPSPERPFLRFNPVDVGATRDLPDGRSARWLPVNHTLPAAALHLSAGSGSGSLVFSGDTTTCPELWAAAANIADLRHVIVETSFPDEELSLAQLSKHYTPGLLAADLARFDRPEVDVHISHLKPGAAASLMEAVAAAAPRPVQALQTDTTLFF